VDGLRPVWFTEPVLPFSVVVILNYDTNMHDEQDSGEYSSLEGPDFECPYIHPTKDLIVIFKKQYDQVLGLVEVKQTIDMTKMQHFQICLIFIVHVYNIFWVTS
jgi:hypothetical protein